MKRVEFFNQIVRVVCCGLFLLPTLVESRPKVGLVLAGGGALGITHAGVLKELEQLQIPIDYIGGTSMGAVVAGMYASGMSPEEIEERFTTLDWSYVLHDQSPYALLEYRKKLDYKHFMGAEFGLKRWKVQRAPGIAYGQKLNNVISTFAMNSIGIQDFDQLNIPYRAVATDLVSGKSIVFKSGDLSKVMRASMSVPGVFTPIKMDGMVLVDGGVLDNVPVDVVKAMGADIIIAVDLGATDQPITDFDSLNNVLLQSYNVMQRPSQIEQLSRADVVITPFLPGISSADFKKAKQIIPLGQEAAKKMHDSLVLYSVDTDIFDEYLKNQRKKHVNDVQVSSIEITGNERVSEAFIRERVHAKEGLFDLATVDQDLNRIYGMGNFQTVNYVLSPSSSNEYHLAYDVVEKFWGPAYLRFGTKITTTSDSTALWSLLLHYTQTGINSLGGEIRVNLEGGGYKRFVSAEWYQPVSTAGRFFVAPTAFYLSEDVDSYLTSSSGVTYNLDRRRTYGALDLGYSFLNYGVFRVGLIGGHASVMGAPPVLAQKVSDSVVGISSHLRINQLDDPIFPTKGYQIDLDGLFVSEEIGSSESFSKVNLHVNLPFSVRKHTLSTMLALGSSLGTDLPMYESFYIGGIYEFAGTAPYQFHGNYYGVGTLFYRYQLAQLPSGFGEKLYLLVRGDVGNAWDSTSDINAKDLTYGSLVGVGMNTVLGTCTLAIGKADHIKPRIYFSIGNLF